MSFPILKQIFLELKSSNDMRVILNLNPQLKLILTLNEVWIIIVHFTSFLAPNIIMIDFFISHRMDLYFKFSDQRWGKFFLKFED